MMLKTLKSKSILYVEDEPEIQASIAEYLQNYFAEVYLAKDGNDALEKYQIYQPDVLLLDINIPKVDGLTIAQKTRKNNKHIKIILLTAHTEKEKLLKATELKLIKYLIKPVSPREFKETMKLLADEFLEDQIDQIDQIDQNQILKKPNNFVIVQVLGNFNIYIKGELLTFKRKAPVKTLQLLKCIISLGCINIPVIKIVDALWFDSEGDAARSAFDSTLQRLRKLLNSDLILLLRNNHISLNMQLCWVDAFALEQIIREYSKNSFKPSTQSFDKIINLYQGEFLTEEESYWILPYREKIQLKLIQTLEVLYQNLPIETSPQKKIKIIEKILLLVPQSELFHQYLMQQHIKQGQISDAILVYKRCEKILQRDLSVEPSEKTHQLLLDISIEPEPVRSLHHRIQDVD